MYVNCSDAAPKTTVIDTAIIQAKPGQGCPRCGGVVFAAEQVLSKGRVSFSSLTNILNYNMSKVSIFMKFFQFY